MMLCTKYPAGLLPMLLLTLLMACGKKDEIKETDPQQLRGEIPPTEVRTVEVKRGPFEYLIKSQGVVQAAAEVAVRSKTRGELERIGVRNGQRVTAGTLLITFSGARQQLALREAELRLQEKQLAFQDQILNYAGTTDTLRYGEARKNIRITSGLAAAEVAYQTARLEYQHQFVYAPLGGVISDLQVQPGNLVNEGDLLCRIHHAEHFTVTCDVLETDALLIKKGYPAMLRLAGGEAAVLMGEVEEVNPRVDEKTRLVKVRVRLKRAANLLPGMSVQVELHIPFDERLLVPKEAVVVRSGRNVVFTAEDGLAKWNYVTLGRENGKEVEILEGLTEGKQAIVTNNLQLAHDAPVVNGRQ